MRKTHNDRFNVLLSKELKGITTDGELVVVLNDVGAPPFYYANNVVSGKMYRGTVDSENVFREHDLEAKLAMIEAEDEIIRVKAEAKAKADADYEAKQVYVFENICGGNDAAGGGCGAAMSLETTTKEEFEAVKATMYFEFLEHHDHEASARMVKIRDEGYMRLKARYSACSGCRIRY